MDIERQIIVTDKYGKRIAVFSNMSTLHTKDSKKEMIVGPTVDIVSNGESTLSFQMLVASEKWQQIKSPENLYYCNNRVYTAINEKSYTYNGLVVDVTLVELWYLLQYQFVKAYNVDTKIEPLDEHTVKILPKTASNIKLTVDGIVYDDSQVKDSRGVIMPRGSAGYALWAILRGSGWSLGVCDVLPDGFSAKDDYGTFNVETDMKSVLENVEYVQQLYGGILVWDSLNKTVSLRDEKKEGTDFNKWKGFVARYGKNLVEFPFVTWDNDLITRLYPLGNGNLNIARVNGGKNYIDDFSYTNDIYEGYLQNPNIYDTNDEGGQKTLKFWAEQEIKKYCRPRKSIEYHIVDKRGTEEGWTEPFDINDVIKAYYQDTETCKEVWEYLRIQHLTYNWFWPGSDTVIEVGDKVSNEIELFYQIYKDSRNSVKTDASGNISAEDIIIELPYDYLYEMYGDNWQSVFSNGGGYGSLAYITRIHAEHETKNTQAVADLHAYADATFTTIDSFTYFKNETADNFSESFTRIQQTSDALQAQITLEAAHYNETKKGISDANAKITATANSLSAEISAKASYSYVDQETGKVSSSLAEFRAYAANNYASASMVSSLNDSVASISTSVNSLYNGKASISAASISADNIFINANTSGYISGLGTVSATRVNCSYLSASTSFQIFGKSVGIRTIDGYRVLVQT